MSPEISDFLKRPVEPRALVLERAGALSLRPIPLTESLGPGDVRVAVHTVGICGSDVHYYTHGAIGSFKVTAPMVLGHEASGIVEEVGSDVVHLQRGDRVCMEPGIPKPAAGEVLAGRYNLDPDVRFWATPPVHGVLRHSVVHPAAFTFKLPDNVSFAAGAMVEPLAVGVHAMNKARIPMGGVAVVIGAGPIGLLTALCAKAAGCSQVIVGDVDDTRLAFGSTLGLSAAINVRRESLESAVHGRTDGRGADVVFECSGNEQAAGSVFALLGPGGVAVYVGMPAEPIRYDVTAAQVKELRIEHVFRYANVFPQAIAMLASGQLSVDAFVTRTFPFADSIAAFQLAAQGARGEVKLQIRMG